MVRNIVRDQFLLARKAQDAQRSDTVTGQDLTDTLRANRDRCVGMAANMIGINRRVIAVAVGEAVLLMYNPAIVSRSGPYEAQEGCLSLDGVRTAQRFQRITVDYQDRDWKRRRETFTGWTAQIIQHEIDHTNGILI